MAPASASAASAAAVAASLVADVAVANGGHVLLQYSQQKKKRSPLGATQQAGSASHDSLRRRISTPARTLLLQSLQGKLSQVADAAQKTNEALEGKLEKKRKQRQWR